MQTFYIANSLRVTTTQQLISDSLTCFAADVLNKAPVTAEAPSRGVSCRPYEAARGAL